MKGYSVLRDLAVSKQLFSLRRNTQVPVLLTWPATLTAIAFFVVAAYIYKIEYFNISFTTAAIAEILASLPVIALATWCRSIFRLPRVASIGAKFELSSKSMKLLTLALIYCIGVVRGALSDAVSVLLEPRDYTNHFAFYLLEGVSFTYFALVYVTISGANRRYNAAVLKLKTNSKIYEQALLQEKKLIKKETEDLKEKTLSQIGPKLDAIFETQKSNSETVALLTLIQDALKNTVRPLGNELYQRSKIEFQENFEKISKRRQLIVMPKTLNPREIFNPTIAILFFSPLYVLGTVVQNPATGFWLGAFQIFSSLLAAQFIKSLMPGSKIKSYLALTIIFIAGFLVDVPSTVIIYLFDETKVSPLVTYLQAVGVTPIWFVAVGYLLIVYLNLNSTEKLSGELEQKLLQHRALLKQKIWVERRNWSYLVHGTIQSSLTAIMVRLSNQVISQSAAVKELKLVLETIKFPPKPNADLLKELDDLEETWRGVADLRFDIDKSALDALSSKAELRFAVNEILRESVSNAIRHGASNLVLVKLEFSSGSLLVDVSNEYIGKLKMNPKSLGSKMFDELTTSWSLTRDRVDGLVHLRAQLLVV